MQLAEMAKPQPISPAAAILPSMTEVSSSDGGIVSGSATPFAQLLGMGVQQEPEQADPEQAVAITEQQQVLAFLLAGNVLGGQQVRRTDPEVLHLTLAQGAEGADDPQVETAEPPLALSLLTATPDLTAATRSGLPGKGHNTLTLSEGDGTSPKAASFPVPVLGQTIDPGSSDQPLGGAKQAVSQGGFGHHEGPSVSEQAPAQRPARTPAWFLAAEQGAGKVASALSSSGALPLAAAPLHSNGPTASPLPLSEADGVSTAVNEAVSELRSPGIQRHEAGAVAALSGGVAAPAAESSQLVRSGGPQQPVHGREIAAQVADGVVHQAGKGDGQISITLRPEELGEVRLTVRLENQRLQVEVVAENRMVRDALMDNLQTLRDSLERQNLRMERFDVNVGGNGSGNGPGQGFAQGGRAEQGLKHHEPQGMAGLDQPPLDDSSSQGDEGESTLVDLRL